MAMDKHNCSYYEIHSEQRWKEKQMDLISWICVPPYYRLDIFHGFMLGFGEVDDVSSVSSTLEIYIVHLTRHGGEVHLLT